MRKIITLDEHFPTGEATFQPAVLVGRNGRSLREDITKTASEASEYIKSVEPKPGHTIALLLALGAYETYDINRNGDGFNEHPYKPGVKPTCGCCHATNGWVEPAGVIGQHYKTFETHATVYKHHRNKDPSQNFGDVLKAFWNPYMHRVELLVGIDNARAPDIVERVNDGEYPAVSMGCKIKFDVCTICGHRAPTRAQYCDHLKFQMRQVMPSGLRAGALNPSPVFFDISFVVRPADQTGFMLKKVAEHAYEIRSSAELGEYLDNFEAKQAALQKLSDIDKVIRGEVVDHRTSPLSKVEANNIQKYQSMVLPAIQQMPEMDGTTLRGLAKHPVANVLSTLSAAGVILTTPEFIQILVEKLAPGTRLNPEILNRAVDAQSEIFQLFATHPQLLDQLLETGMFDLGPEKVDPEIGMKAERYLEKRSTISDYLSRALIPAAIRTEEPNWTDPLTVTDPSTGTQYGTTRGAARDSHDAIARKQLAKIVGGGALLAGAHKVVSAGLPAALRPLSAAAAGAIGYSTLKPEWGPQYMSDQGVAIPMITELRKTSDVRSIALPILGSAALVAALSHDYAARLRRGEPAPTADSDFGDRAAHTLGRHAYDHPGLSFIGGLGAYGLGKSLLGKIAAVEDSVRLPALDVDSIAEKLGSLLIP